MIIKIIPQIRDNNRIWYEIEHHKITATVNDISDTFDFSEMPDGILQMWDEHGESVIETELPEIPFLGAEKENGVLTVNIIFSIDLYEEDERLLFPEPMSLIEFNDLMAELVERQKEVEPDGEDDLEK